MARRRRIIRRIFAWVLLINFAVLLAASVILFVRSFFVCDVVGRNWQNVQYVKPGESLYIWQGQISGVQSAGGGLVLFIHDQYTYAFTKSLGQEKWIRWHWNSTALTDWNRANPWVFVFNRESADIPPEHREMLGENAGVWPAGHRMDAIPYWFLLLLFALLTYVCFRQTRRLPAQTRIALHLCTNCSYDLRAHHPGDKCPECGTPVTLQTDKVTR